MTFHRIMIANRGEIAARIIRTCRRLGIETVLAASDIDLNSVPARLADWVIRLGGSRPAASYLNVDAVIAAARDARADAVHPGYGFLSENAALARACAASGIVFIGPTEAQLSALGDKLKARDHALAAGLPVLPGGSAVTDAEAKALAERIEFPLLIKAVGGGGGRGMKRVDDASRLVESIHLAMSEAEAAFANSRIYLERYVTSGRHVEVQVLGDGKSVIHLGDRDCSVQRRYQKLIEEAPAPDLPGRVRTAMREAAVRFSRHLEYRGLGTVEFLYNSARVEFYFLEMNARIQVEHPVTEAITGLDLIEHQIAVAEGWPLRLRQDEVRLTGHAIECRINAEDWARDFQPTPGTLTATAFPIGPGLRVDTHIEKGTKVPPFYDSLVAKIIAHGSDRAAALAMLRNALADCHIEGVATNLGMHREILSTDAFAAAALDTTFLTHYLAGRDASSDDGAVDHTEAANG